MGAGFVVPAPSHVMYQRPPMWGTEPFNHSSDGVHGGVLPIGSLALHHCMAFPHLGAVADLRVDACPEPSAGALHVASVRCAGSSQVHSL